MTQNPPTRGPTGEHVLHCVVQDAFPLPGLHHHHRLPRPVQTSPPPRSEFAKEPWNGINVDICRTRGGGVCWDHLVHPSEGTVGRRVRLHLLRQVVKSNPTTH